MAICNVGQSAQAARHYQLAALPCAVMVWARWPPTHRRNDAPAPGVCTSWVWVCLGT